MKTTKKEKLKIVILGTGNVASQLGTAFLKAKHDIIQVYGRNASHAKAIAIKLKTNHTSKIKAINQEGEIYIIAVSDSSIEKVVKELQLEKQIVVHTSGSVSINVFEKKFINYGVFYPLQTISKNNALNFKTTPVCIEASNDSTQTKLMQLAKSISDKIHLINSEERSVIHLAAVFVNNFTNHLFHIGEKILAEKKLSFDLLKPLINETVNKLKTQTPLDSQTGPALRNDKNIINKQLTMLKKYPAYKKIYKDITQSIQQIKK